MVWKKKKKCRYSNFSYLLVPKTMSPLHVQSEVCMAPFHVLSKVCIASFLVWSKLAVFGPHIKRSNADFSPHKEASHTPGSETHLKKPKKPNIIFLPIKKKLCQTIYILEVYMTYLTTFRNRNILRERTIKIHLIWLSLFGLKSTLTHKEILKCV